MKIKYDPNGPYLLNEKGTILARLTIPGEKVLKKVPEMVKLLESVYGEERIETLLTKIDNAK